MPQQPTFDPGLTEKYTGQLQRAINDNGEFNVRRSGTNWRDIHPYLVLTSISWSAFLGVVLGSFAVVNLLFAGAYVAAGLEHLKGSDASSDGLRFLNAFFFSTHTLTTVGYGNIYPDGPLANSLAAFEALVGLLGFAVVTGLMFGRFSKGSARLEFSRHMLISPYGNGTSLQFRVVNRRSYNLLEVNAQLLLMTVESVEGRMKRKFAPLTLERDQVLFLALNWTVVHPINESSPLYGKTAEELAQLQAEVMILMKGFDETFGQVVHTRRSYRHDQIQWGARFLPTFVIEDSGDLRLDINKVSDHEKIDLPPVL